MKVISSTALPVAWAAVEDDESQAIRRILDGETAAFRLLVDRHQQRLHRILFRLMRSREDAAELTQQAFLSAFSALARYDDRYPFGSWLVRIGVNLAKDHLKAARRREVQQEPAAFERLVAPPDASPEASMHTVETRRVVSAAFAKLSIADRELLVLKDVEELSFAEIRVILDRPITALKIHAIRARRRLRKVLEQSQPAVGA